LENSNFSLHVKRRVGEEARVSGQRGESARSIKGKSRKERSRKTDERRVGSCKKNLLKKKHGSLEFDGRINQETETN